MIVSGVLAVVPIDPAQEATQYSGIRVQTVPNWFRFTTDSGTFLLRDSPTRLERSQGQRAVRRDESLIRPTRSSWSARLVSERAQLDREARNEFYCPAHGDTMTNPDPSTTPPTSGPADAVDEIVRISKRKNFTPVRNEFLQREDDGKKLPGPASSLITSGDHRGLLLYLLLLTKASSEPWDAALPAAAWARALGIPLPESKTARSTISKIWLRLERRGLVRRERKQRLADVFLCAEDGLGDPYTAPGAVGDRYFRVPLELWTEGPDAHRRWYQDLSLPELYILLVGRSLGDDFRLPVESAPEWYQVSADTVNRGLLGLQSKGLIVVDQTFKKAPLSAVGYTAEHRYTLQAPFGPVGRRSGAPAPKKRRPAPRPIAKKATASKPKPTAKKAAVSKPK